MIYRYCAGELVSQLGFGAMRLPNRNGKVLVDEAVRLMHHAMDHGINYIDTAWIYHNGTSEGIVGQAIKDRRSKVMIADKSPVWEMKSKADFDRILDTQLERLGTDYIDFYLLHALNAGSWKTCQELEAMAFLERAKAAGKIRHFGFSFHDRPEVFPDILHAWPWEFCQIQFNYLDQGPAQGHPGTADAKAHGTDIIIMEPLRGGNLAGPLPRSAQAVLDSSGRSWTPAEWALRWIWDKADPALVLSGMSTMAQLEENLEVAASAHPDSLGLRERELVEHLAVELRGQIKVPCTDCRYCMPCPFGIDIPGNFQRYNELFMFAENPAVRSHYTWIPEAARAMQCKDCGVCAPKCPQQIAIPERLREVAASFG